MKILTPKSLPGNKVDNLISELIWRADRLLEHVRKIDELLSNHPISKVETDVTPGENSVTCDSRDSTDSYCSTVTCDSSDNSYVTEPSFSPELEEIFIETPPR